MERAAKAMLLQAGTIEDEAERTKMKLAAYAYAASEQNASAGIVVTAPTLGSCGVMAALMYYYYNDQQITRGKLVKALAVAGLFGDLIKPTPRFPVRSAAVRRRSAQPARWPRPPPPISTA